MSVRCGECPVDGTVTDAGPEGPEDPVGSQRMFCAVAKRITAATQRHRIKRCITWYLKRREKRDKLFLEFNHRYLAFHVHHMCFNLFEMFNMQIYDNHMCFNLFEMFNMQIYDHH